MNLSLLMINFAVIFFLKDLVGLNASSIGWYFAAGYGCYAVGCIAIRPVQNKILPPVSMFIAIAMTVFSLLMISRSTSPGAVLVYYMIFSMAPTFYWPQVMGWFSYGLSNDELSKSISRFNVSWSSGALVGPLLGGILAERNIMMSFYLDIGMIGAIALLLIIGLIFIKDMRNFPAHTAPAANGPATHETGLEEELSEPTEELLNGGKGTVLRFCGWIGVYSVYVVLGLMSNIFPLFIRETLGFGESVAGNLLFARGLTTAIGFYLLGRVTFWHFNRKIMLITQAATAVLMVIMVFVKLIPVFYLLLILFGVLFSLAYSNGIFHGSAGALDRGRRMGLFEAILTLGVITGSVGGGYLLQYASIRTAFILTAVIIALGFAAQILIFSLSKQKNLP